MAGSVVPPSNADRSAWSLALLLGTVVQVGCSITVLVGMLRHPTAVPSFGSPGNMGGWIFAVVIWLMFGCTFALVAGVTALVGPANTRLKRHAGWATIMTFLCLLAPLIASAIRAA